MTSSASGSNHFNSATQASSISQSSEVKPSTALSGLTSQTNNGHRFNTALLPAAPKVSSCTSSILNHSNLIDNETLSPHAHIFLMPPSGNTRRLSAVFSRTLSPFQDDEPFSGSLNVSTSRRSSDSKESRGTPDRFSLFSDETHSPSPPIDHRRNSSLVNTPQDLSLPSITRNRRSSSSVFGFDQGVLKKLESKEASKAKIPEGIEHKVSAWLKENEATLKIDSNRVSYEEKDIHKAIEAFKTECQCSWKEMKHRWGSDPSKLIPLQIINDLRKMEIKEITVIVQGRYQGLKVLNAGSSDLTSDCDLSLGLENDRGKEIDAVATYRQVFAERGWGASSAYIFDNNSYTQFYIEQLNNFENQLDQQNMQNTMSLVMFARNAGPANWEALKTSLLKEADPTTGKELEKQFVIVESMVHELQFVNDNETLKEGIKDDGSNSIKNNPDMASQIRIKNPDLIIKVDGQLEVKFKTMVKETIEARVELNANIEKMQKTVDPGDCLNIYKEILGIASKFMNEEIARLKDQKTNTTAESARIGELDPKKATPLREYSTEITRNIQVLERDLIAFNNISSIDSDSFSTSVKEWGEITSEIKDIKQKLRIINDLPLTLHMLKDQKIRLNNSLNGGNVEKTMGKLADVEDKISNVSLQMHGVEDKSKELKDKLIELNDKLDDLNAEDKMRLDFLLIISDRMQNAIELNSMKAQCFAQEAHVTSGAIGFVVNDIQMEELHARNINGYSQAVNELMGFYHAHQAHSETPHGKMIEVSKYVGPRLMEAYARMEIQATSQRIPFPEIKEQKAIKQFFNELLVLRKSKGLTDGDKQALVEKLGKQYNMPLTKGRVIDSKAIDQIMMNIQAKIIAWVNKLSPEDRLG